MNEKTYGTYLQDTLKNDNTLSAYVAEVYLLIENTAQDIDVLLLKHAGNDHNVIVIANATVTPGDIIASSGSQLFVFSADIYAVMQNPGKKLNATSKLIDNVYGTLTRGKELGTFSKDIINLLKLNKLTSNYLNLSGKIIDDSEAPYEIINEDDLPTGVYAQRLVHEGKRYEAE